MVKHEGLSRASGGQWQGVIKGWSKARAVKGKGVKGEGVARGAGWSQGVR